MKDLAPLKAQIEAVQSGVESDPVKIAADGGWAYAFCFGDIVKLGYMTKSYVPGASYEDTDIVWDLNEDAGFSIQDNYGRVMNPGDEQVWEK